MNECRVVAWNDLEAVDRETYVNRRKDALEKWDSGLVDSDTKEQWEAKARAHLERQPLIRGIIVSAL